MQEYASMAKPGMLARPEYKTKAEVNVLYAGHHTTIFSNSLSSIFKNLFGI